jgi:hypothetical protein
LPAGPFVTSLSILRDPASPYPLDLLFFFFSARLRLPRPRVSDTAARACELARRHYPRPCFPLGPPLFFPLSQAFATPPLFTICLLLLPHAKTWKRASPSHIRRLRRRHSQRFRPPHLELTPPREAPHLLLLPGAKNRARTLSFGWNRLRRLLPHLRHGMFLIDSDAFGRSCFSDDLLVSARFLPPSSPA